MWIDYVFINYILGCRVGRVVCLVNGWRVKNEKIFFVSKQRLKIWWHYDNDEGNMIVLNSYCSGSKDLYTLGHLHY